MLDRFFSLIKFDADGLQNIKISFEHVDLSTKNLTNFSQARNSTSQITLIDKLRNIFLKNMCSYIVDRIKDNVRKQTFCQPFAQEPFFENLHG